MSALRPLPPRPSLEFERKEAKALLRLLRSADPDAVVRARARHSALPPAPNEIRLADAQLIIAREYGFASWPKLVRYFGEVDRLRHMNRGVHSRSHHEAMAQTLVVEHRQRRVWTWRALASYVPRFYGMRPDKVFAATVTEADARLAEARMYGAPSWDALIERVAEKEQLARRTSATNWGVPALRRAAAAIEATDLTAFQRVVEAHPELVTAANHDDFRMSSLLRAALEQEKVQGVDALRPIIDWLGTQGFDLQHELNVQLCSRMGWRATTEQVRWLLDRGADPNWVAPNGYPVLEHALMRYWNGDAVDLIAARTKPRRTFWVAAGLGRVDVVRRYLDASGKPTPAARHLRPDLEVLSAFPMMQHPDADDEEVLMEAFLVAMLNGRAPVMEYMASRGFPVNSLVYGLPILHVAIGNAMADGVECLIRCGADLDLRGWRPDQSGREIAREVFEGNSNDANRRRIVELCGMDADAILAERDARPPQVPVMVPGLQEDIELAMDDARRLGQADVRAHNLLWGLLRGDTSARSIFIQASRMDAERFGRDMERRMTPGLDRVEGPPLPLHPDANAILQAANALAMERRSDVVHALHLLSALLQSPTSGVAELLTRYGGHPAQVMAEVERGV